MTTSSPPRVLPKVLIIGSGGREHALALKLSESRLHPELHFAPGNPGMEPLGQRLEIAVDDIQGLLLHARREGFDLTVVGPEAPLAAGIVDAFKAAGLPIFGPDRAGAQLEASKHFAKELMTEAGVPTAGYAYCTTQDEALSALERFAPPYVIKEDGLAAGKGVTVTASKDEAEAAIEQAMTKHMPVVIEEFLRGEELSVLALCDGTTVLPLVSAQDFKRAGEGDTGPNTGGMGAYAPVPLATPDIMAAIQNRVLSPMLKTLRNRGVDYRGVLYAGLMVPPEGEPNVVEFNVRFGDPETQAVLPLLDEDLLELLLACANGTLDDYAKRGLRFKNRAAVTVVLTAAGYPGAYEKGRPIRFPDTLPEGSHLIHAGTKKMPDQTIVTNGGRVLNAVGLGETIEQARERAYQLADSVAFEGKTLRRDIAETPSRPIASTKR